MKKRDYLERILNARVYDVAIETPLEVAPNLTRRLGNTVLLKREDMQSVFSFKLRGAYNKMAQLSDERLRRGVIAASAGNHAQGVALAAQKLGCTATIVMPVTTPQIKVDLLNAKGDLLQTLGTPAPADGRVRMVLPVGSLANSTYVLRIEAIAGEQTAQQWVAFRVAR